MLHVAFVRSEHAHGRIDACRCFGGKARQGVHAVYTADDLGDYLQPGPLLVTPPPIPDLSSMPAPQLPLAKEQSAICRRADRDDRRVQPVCGRGCASAMSSSTSSRSMPSSISKKALAADAPLVHEHLTSNVAAHVVQRKGDYASARGKAEVVIRRRFSYDRGAVGGHRESCRRRRVECKSRRTDDLGHHAGADSDPKWPGPDARPARVAGQRDRSLRRAADSGRRS